MFKKVLRNPHEKKILENFDTSFPRCFSRLELLVVPIIIFVPDILEDLLQEYVRPQHLQVIEANKEIVQRSFSFF